MATTSAVTIHGTVASGFEPVREEFQRNFAQRGELGAACAVYYRGEKVVDLWGGIRNNVTGEPWEEDTLVLVFSSTKGMSSMGVAVAHSRGLFSYDERVATYWPEFAQAGKEQVTVRQLLSHQAGVCAIDEPLDIEQLADPDQVARAIAKQKPAWEPGTRHGYHAISLGWYESELIRRVDPKHRTIGQFFQDEVARPLQVEFYIGLPEDIPQARIARIAPYPRWQLLFNMNKMPRPFVLAFMNPRSITARSFDNPKLLGQGASYNDPRVQRLELPASNGIGQVRDMAKAYGEFATGGQRLGLREETFNAMKQPAAPPRDGLLDMVLRVETIFSLGYAKPFPAFRFGLGEEAFGTPGAGGSFCFADPAAQIGFAYGMNKMGFYLWDDPREKSLRDAVYRCIA
ncbi:MAG: serine hydrolase domain-containing protein [Ktedonobacterales bacterium]